jgi:ligand-binding sensor protein
MAKLRTRSGKIDIANKRVASLTALSQPVDLGGELSLTAYQSVVTEAKSKQARYNGLVTEAEQARRDYLNAEKSVSDWSERMLAGVGAYYGKNS